MAKGQTPVQLRYAAMTEAFSAQIRKDEIPLVHSTVINQSLD